MRPFVWIAWIALVVALAGALSAPAPASAPTPTPSPAPDICPVHGIKMERKALHVFYGLPSKALFEEMRVAKTEFPYGKDYVLGGCVVGPKRTVEGYLCPKCVEAREAWLKAQKH